MRNKFKNKKKWLGIVLLLLMLVATGCGKPVDEHVNPRDQEVQDAEKIDTEVRPSDILALKQALGEDRVLFYIPNEEIEAGIMQNIASFRGNFLVYGNSTENLDVTSFGGTFYLKLISAQTGELLFEKKFSDAEFPNVQVLDDKIVVKDWANGNIYVLDENLQEKESYQIACEYHSMYVSSDVDKVYVFRPDEGIEVTSLKSNEKEMCLTDAVNLFSSGECGNYVTFSYTDRVTQFDKYGAISLETGEILEYPGKGAVYNINYVNDVWMASSSDDMDVYYLAMDKDIKVLEYPEKFASLTMHPKTRDVLATLYGENGLEKMTMYDTEGCFLSECKNNVPGASTQGDFLWFEADGGYFFLIQVPEGKDLLMFWDMSKQVSGENIVFEEIKTEKLEEGAVSSELYQRARDLGEKHGITIRIAEQMEEDYSDYKAEKCFDEYKITQALNALEHSLSVYPKGFFEQLRHGSIHEVELHLAGSVTNLEIPEGDVNGFTSFAGFAQTKAGKAIVVLDILQEGNIEEHIHHEFFHLIDDKLAFDAAIRPEAVYSEQAWMDLNPKGFEYAYNTFELPEELFEEEYDLWFIELYSRTYPREDRATIMECAMMGLDAMFISAPHRQAKLEYLNQCIRDAFDTAGWPEMTVWEKTMKDSLRYEN